MEVIKSKYNESLKLYVKLSKSKKSRDENDMFTIEGIKLFLEAFYNDIEFHKIFLSKNYYQNNFEDIDKFKDGLENKIYIIDDVLVNNISDTKTPQGIFAICKKLDKNFNIDKIYNKGKHIALCDLQDPGNVGTILRTAEAFGIHGILIGEDCCDIYSPKVIRATMGSIFRVPFILSENFNRDLKIITQNGVETYAAVLNDNSKSLKQTQFKNNTLIVMGNEGKGLSNETIDICKYSLKIDMAGQTESLNVAMATGIIMWELMK